MSTALLTIKTLKEMPEMVIPGTQGTLVEVKDHRQVNGAKGPTTAQDFKLQDQNDWIFGTVWGKPDISPWAGKRVLFVSNKTGNNKLAGVSIKERPSKDGSKTYKNIYVTAAGTLHDPDTYESSKGVPAPQQQAPVEAQPAPQAQQQAPFVPKPAMKQLPQKDMPLMTYAQAFPNAVNGQTVGMSVKAAIDILIASGAVKDGKFADDALFGAVHRLASGIIGVSQRLERGDLVVNDPAVGYTQADTAGIESFERAIPQPRPKPTPGPGGSALPTDDSDQDVPF